MTRSALRRSFAAYGIPNQEVRAHSPRAVAPSSPDHLPRPVDWSLSNEPDAKVTWIALSAVALLALGLPALAFATGHPILGLIGVGVVFILAGLTAVAWSSEDGPIYRKY